MANPNDEPLRARGRPATPETALRATLAQATLALLLDGGYAAATVDAVAKRAGVAKNPVSLCRQPRRTGGAGGKRLDRGVSAGLRPRCRAAGGGCAAVGKGLQAIAQQVLSAEAVGMFRLLQSEFPGREGCWRATSATVFSAAGRRWRTGCSASSSAGGCVSATGRKPATCCWR